MEIYLKSVIICVILSTIHGFYINDNDSNNKNIKNDKIVEDYSKILESWSNFKRKLQQNYNKDITIKDNFDESSNTFNELEVVKMIPIIIDELRQKKLSINDEKLLSEIYGNLWSMICDEAKRTTTNNNNNNEEKNPLLEALLQSFYLTDNNNNNDIDGNTVNEKKALHKKSSPTTKLLLNVNKLDHPSQRVLNTAAMLIHQVMNSNDLINKKKTTKIDNIKMPSKTSKYNNHVHNQRRHHATLNLQLKNIPITKITRTKRNIKFHLSSSNSMMMADLPSHQIDAILRIYKQQNGIKDNDIDDDDDDDDDYDINEGIDMNDFKTMNTDAGRDYLYDDLYEDDEEVSSHHDSDSFQDLILLANKNRLREEEEENRLKHIQNKRHFLSTN